MILMIIGTETYIFALIIVILAGIIWGLRRIISLEENMSFLLDAIKSEEDKIDKKISSGGNFKATRDKMVMKKKLLGKIKKK
ncbi:MAG: hypothetical protein KAJ88_02930 [Candidatus Aenigmarchaeota archaeon]|nr:hypothetical protein [Candidatus Aenigmarchaeota archaeon]